MDESTLKFGHPLLSTTSTSDGIKNCTLGALAQVIRNSKNEIHYAVIDLSNPSKGTKTSQRENLDALLLKSCVGTTFSRKREAVRGRQLLQLLNSQSD